MSVSSVKSEKGDSTLTVDELLEKKGAAGDGHAASNVVRKDTPMVNRRQRGADADAERVDQQRRMSDADEDDQLSDGRRPAASENDSVFSHFTQSHAQAAMTSASAEFSFSDLLYGLRHVNDGAEDQTLVKSDFSSEWSLAGNEGIDVVDGDFSREEVIKLLMNKIFIALLIDDETERASSVTKVWEEFARVPALQKFSRRDLADELAARWRAKQRGMMLVDRHQFLMQQQDLYWANKLHGAESRVRQARRETTVANKELLKAQHALQTAQQHPPPPAAAVHAAGRGPGQPADQSGFIGFLKGEVLARDKELAKLRVEIVTLTRQLATAEERVRRQQPAGADGRTDNRQNPQRLQMQAPRFNLPPFSGKPSTDPLDLSGVFKAYLKENMTMLRLFDEEAKLTALQAAFTGPAKQYLASLPQPTRISWDLLVQAMHKKFKPTLVGDKLVTYVCDKVIMTDQVPFVEHLNRFNLGMWAIEEYAAGGALTEEHKTHRLYTSLSPRLKRHLRQKFAMTAYEYDVLQVTIGATFDELVIECEAWAAITEPALEAAAKKADPVKGGGQQSRFARKAVQQKLGSSAAPGAEAGASAAGGGQKLSDTSTKVAPSQQSRSGQECFNCREAGHMSRDCPKPKREQKKTAPKVAAVDTLDECGDDEDVVFDAVLAESDAESDAGDVGRLTLTCESKPHGGRAARIIHNRAQVKGTPPAPFHAGAQ
jgi:hypothetical protein